METIKVSSRGKGVSNGISESSYLVPDASVGYLIGRICTIIETAGFSDKQEKALKDLMKQEVHHAIYGDNGSVYIDDTLAGVIRSTLWEAKTMAQAEGMPSWPYGDYELTYTPSDPRIESGVKSAIG